MRELKTLLEILLREHSQDTSVGICGSMDRLLVYSLVNNLEYQSLRQYIRANRPTITRYPEHYLREYRDSAYWWPKGNKELRIKFLEHLISLQPRTIKELLQILLEFYKNRGEEGLCRACLSLFFNNSFTKQEYDRLSSFLAANRPSRFVHPKHYVKHRSIYWWPVHNPLFIYFTKRPRIKFLNYLIQLQDAKP